MDYLILVLAVAAFLMPPHSTTIDLFSGLVLALVAFVVGVSIGQLP